MNEKYDESQIELAIRVKSAVMSMALGVSPEYCRKKYLSKNVNVQGWVEVGDTLLKSMFAIPNIPK